MNFFPKEKKNSSARFFFAKNRFLGRFIYVPVPDPLPNLLNVDEGENSLINLRRLSLIHNVRTYKMEHTLPQTTTDWINTMVRPTRKRTCYNSVLFQVAEKKKYKLITSEQYVANGCRINAGEVEKNMRLSHDVRYLENRKEILEHEDKYMHKVATKQKGYRENLKSYSIDRTTGTVKHEPKKLRTAGWQSLYTSKSYQKKFALPAPGGIQPYLLTAAPPPSESATLVSTPNSESTEVISVVSPPPPPKRLKTTTTRYVPSGNNSRISNMSAAGGSVMSSDDLSQQDYRAGGGSNHVEETPKQASAIYFSGIVQKQQQQDKGVTPTTTTTSYKSIPVFGNKQIKK